MTSYRVIFQDRGNDSRRLDTTYVRVRAWHEEKYLGAWFGLLNGRAERRYLVEKEQVDHYASMAPIALALTIRAAVEQGMLDGPRDIALHPTEVLQLTAEDHIWATGDEVLTFELP